VAFSKLRFFCVVGAELRAEVFAIGGAPDFHVTIPKKEWLVAERAASEIAAPEMLAARDHPCPHSTRNSLNISPQKIAVR
jgi:hypothetical protein